MFGFINFFFGFLSTGTTESSSFGGSLASNHPVAKSEARKKTLNKVRNMNVKVFDLRSGVNETRFLVQHESCEFKCRLNENQALANQILNGVRTSTYSCFTLFCALTHFYIKIFCTSRLSGKYLTYIPHEHKPFGS